MPAKKQSEDLKIYVIRCHGDNIRKITIPADWKITFGKLHGGKGGGDDKFGNSRYEKGGNVLRIYESAEKQRAIFTDVDSFIDVSINPQKLVKNKKQIAEILNKKGVTEYKDVCNITELWVSEFTDWENE